MSRAYRILPLVVALAAPAAGASDDGEGWGSAPRPAERAKDRADAVKELKGALAQVVQNTALKGARTGVMVASLDTGELIYASDPDELLNPASNVKLFTSAVALARLGPEYRFDTEFYVDDLPRSGTLKGPLYVKGKGDPSIVTEKLYAIAGDIQHQGVKTIKGDLVIDDGYFDGERQGPGYDQESGDKSYLAPAGAVSLNFNAVAIHVAPGDRVGQKGAIAIEPMSDFFTVENKTTTVKRTARRRVVPSSIPQSGKQKILVVARLPVGSRDQVFYRKIDDPPLYFGYTLKKLLEQRGVRVTGKVRKAATPKDARLFFVHESDELADILRMLDKHSNNFIAEQLIKTVGAEVKGPPGSWAKGIEATEDFLAELGLPRGSYVMKNGSGLNDTNRFSARQIVTLLREMYQRFPLQAEFVGALPIAGKDGTIKWRMEGTDAVGHLRAKTGTLENVTSLSGYVATKGGEKLVFAVIVNDYPGRYAQVVRAVDAIGGVLAAAFGPSAAVSAAVAAASPPPSTPPPSTASALADLKAHVATYYKLGLAGDPRNVAFLRTALRTEKDTVLRSAVAEAIYLSDPDSESAQATFLENVATDAQTVERLRSLAAELNLPDPVVSSIADLAAEGSSDALARLVELAPVAAADPEMQDGFADTLAEVARTAPEELLIALKGSPPQLADATLTELCRGLSREQATKDKEENPFPGVVKAAFVHPDANVAAFAKSFEPRFEERLQAVQAAMKAAQAAPAVVPLPITAPAPPAKSESKQGG